MKTLGDLSAAQNSVLEHARTLLETIRRCAANEPETVAEAIGMLAEIRVEAYEDLNQLQHEYLILCSATWLVDTQVVPSSVSWQWNPHQTGDKTEPDLAAESDQKRLVSAEITTLGRPYRHYRFPNGFDFGET